MEAEAAVCIRFNSRKETLLFIRNQMNKKTGYALIHLLSHLRGHAFESVHIGSSSTDLSLLLNPAVLECFSSRPLDIRCEMMRLPFAAVPDKSLKRAMKKQIRSPKVETRVPMSQLFQMIAEPKWCPSYELRVVLPIGNLVDELIKVGFF